MSKETLHENSISFTFVLNLGATKFQAKEIQRKCNFQAIYLTHIQPILGTFLGSVVFLEFYFVCLSLLTTDLNITFGGKNLKQRVIFGPLKMGFWGPKMEFYGEILTPKSWFLELYFDENFSLPHWWKNRGGGQDLM